MDHSNKISFPPKIFNHFFCNKINPLGASAVCSTDILSRYIYAHSQLRKASSERAQTVESGSTFHWRAVLGKKEYMW